MKKKNKNFKIYQKTKINKNIYDLIEIMKLLRDPKEGCPWDIKQTFSSIIPHMIEEAYEVSDAIERNSFYELKNELGDLLLQVVFLSQIAKENKFFDFNDVINSITNKLIERHPHIFEEQNNLENEDQVKVQWEKIKSLERKAENSSKEVNSDLDQITNNLPSIIKSNKIQERASFLGFDWKNTKGSFEKLSEEIEELKKAEKGQKKSAIEEECGDLLFSVINVVRKFKVNPDKALMQANNKFVKRYKTCEMLAKKDGLIFSEIELEIKNFYWEKSKKLLIKN